MGGEGGGGVGGWGEGWGGGAERNSNRAELSRASEISRDKKTKTQFKEENRKKSGFPHLRETVY